MKKIGLLGGTFDPIHFGHLNLAFELSEKKQLDEVWFIPARKSPFKMGETFFSVNDRLVMVQLAIEGIPQFKLIDIETKRPSPSYTIDTLKELSEKVKTNSTEEVQFFLLLGEDALQGFPKWQLSEEILKYATLLVGSRYEQVPLQKVENPVIRTSIQQGLVQTRLLDISSTDIRHRLSNRQYCGHLVPAKVLDFILKTRS